MKVCPDCNSTNFKVDREKGEMVCQGCGLVIVEQSMIDFDRKWEDFDDKDGKRARTGSPLTH